MAKILRLSEHSPLTKILWIKRDNISIIETNLKYFYEKWTLYYTRLICITDFEKKISKWLRISEYQRPSNRNVDGIDKVSQFGLLTLYLRTCDNNQNLDLRLSGARVTEELVVWTVYLCSGCNKNYFEFLHFLDFNI